MSATARLRERVSIRTEAAMLEAKVKGNVVEGVVILGPNSLNKGESGKPRVYTEKAMKAACEKGVYEGVQSYIDHSETTGARPTRQLLGVFKNPRFEDGKVKGDLVVSKREEWFLEDAKDPDISKAMGFSHDAFVDIDETDEAEEVTGIPEAISVDLVSRPATTKGVFESANSSTRARTADASQGASMAADTKAEPTAEQKATEARLQKLEQENTKLRLAAALAKYPEKAREAVMKRLEGKVLTDAEIAAEVATLDAMQEAFKKAPEVDPDLAGVREGEGEDESDGESNVLLLREAFGAPIPTKTKAV